MQILPHSTLFTGRDTIATSASVSDFETPEAHLIYAMQHVGTFFLSTQIEKLG